VALSFLYGPLRAKCRLTILIEGFCGGLEFKAGFEKSFKFEGQKSLKCFGKREDGLEKLGICLSPNVCPYAESSSSRMRVIYHNAE